MTATTCTGACGGEPDCDGCEPADGAFGALLVVCAVLLFVGWYFAVTR